MIYAKLTAALALCLAMTACGGGGDDGPSAPPKQPEAFEPSTSLLVIGNSITRHGPNPSIGWFIDAGMAASAPEKDFAHLVAAGVGVPLTTINAYLLEVEPATAPLPPFVVDKHTAVVIELGDNVQLPNLAAFGEAYDDLLSAMPVRGPLVCVSTFWVAAAKDAVIKAACEKHGGTFVYIGDIHTDPANRDLLDGPQYAHPGVQAHPHDWSMAKIAERILAALP